MSTFDHIVVALRSPSSDEHLVRYAVTLARLGRTKTVRLVHVAEPGASPSQLRAELRTQTAPAFDGLDAVVECDVLQGALTDRLVAYVDEFKADLILIGSKKRKLGARLAMVAPCAVCVVPAGHTGRLSHIMAAVDFSEGALHTLRWATRLGSVDPTLRFTALHVMTHESAELFAEDDDERRQELAGRLAEAGLTGVEPHLVDLRRSTDVGLSHPFSFAASIEGADVAHTILAEAETVGADCVALSTRGRSRSAAILLGSVTEKVIERATMPLLIGRHSSTTLGLVSILLGRGTRDVGVKTN